MDLQSNYSVSHGSDEKAREIYSRALSFQYTLPKNALSDLMNLIEQYKETWTVRHLAIDAAIEIALKYGFYDDALKICWEAQQLDAHCGKVYRLESEAIQLERSNRFIDAAKKRLEKDISRGECFGTYQKYGDTLIQLGDFEAATELLNQALKMAEQEGLMIFDILRSKAVLLRMKGQSTHAVNLLLQAIDNASRWNISSTPVEIIKELSRNFQNCGIKEPDAAKMLNDICRKEGVEPAIATFSKWLQELTI